MPTVRIVIFTHFGIAALGSAMNSFHDCECSLRFYERECYLSRCRDRAITPTIANGNYDHALAPDYRDRDLRLSQARNMCVGK
jgi:hypothetical protein